MPRIPIFKLGRARDQILPPQLGSYTPKLTMDDLQLGVDNLRHDVHLSARFVEQVRQRIARLIIRHGDMDVMLAAEASEPKPGNHFVGSMGRSQLPKATASELKSLLADLHLSALNRAKAAENLSVDVLARVAIIKFLRIELNQQFAQMLERGRMMLKSYEGVRQQKALEYRERVAGFQVAKKIILRKTGQELFRILREIEKETLARTRRSLFGNVGEEEYKLFLNPLLFTEDGADTYLNAEHYVMLGNFDRDPDRFANVRRVVRDFLLSLNLGSAADDDLVVDGWLNVPENAHQLLGSGQADETTPEGRAQKARMDSWVELLEREKLMDYAIASYEAVPLLAEYSPRINAQQLKHSLISREERDRVEKLIEEHGKLSAGSLYSAMARFAACRGADRAKT